MANPLLESQLASRLDAADNPDWYLSLYGAALERSGGDPARALRVADRTAAEHPQPPATAEDAELKRVADACALHGAAVENRLGGW